MQYPFVLNPISIAVIFMLITSCSKEEMSISPTMTPQDSKFEEGILEWRSADLEIFNIMQIEIQRDSTSEGDTRDKIDIDDDEKEYVSHVKFSPFLKLMGSGGGVSEDFGRCITTFQLTYNLLTHQVRGEVICEFYLSKSQMHFRLIGSDPVQTISQFDGPHDALVLETELISATGIFSNSSIDMKTFLLDANLLDNPQVDNLNTILMITGSLN